MRQEGTDAMLERLAELAEAHYVFPEVGAALAALLAERQAAGRYAAAADEVSLAALVTEDLQAVNGDQHLRLLYSAEEVPDESDDSAEMAGVRRLDGNVGYLELRPILFPPLIAGAAATAAMSVVAQADVLIVDLRQCRGGDPEMVALLCSYLFDEPVHLTDTFERAGNQTRQSWTLPYTPGRKFGGAKPVYVLTSATTFSGGEEVSYDLQQLGRATMVGERTKGGAHPRQGFRLSAHLQATIPVARTINPVSGTNWEGSGVAPDIEVAADDAFAAAYRRALEHVLGLGDDGLRAEIAAEARRAIDSLADSASH